MLGQNNNPQRTLGSQTTPQREALMPLETATYVNQLTATNPTAADGISQGDDHLRLIKAVLQSTFPNVTGAVTATQAALNSAATLDPSGGPRSVAVGSIHAFPKSFTGLGVAGSGTTNTYLECDGTTTWTFAAYPDLAAYLGSTYGGNGTTTFGVPDLKTTGRFLRSRTASVAVGTSQSNQNKSHTHSTAVSLSGTTGTDSVDHFHTFSGTTSGQSADHTHKYGSGTLGGPSGGGSLIASGTTNDTSGTSNDHTHTFSGSTSGINASHTHSWSGSGTFTSGIGSADGTEARPENFSVIYAIKT